MLLLSSKPLPVMGPPLKVTQFPAEPKQQPFSFREQAQPAISLSEGSFPLNSEPKQPICPFVCNQGQPLHLQLLHRLERPLRLWHLALSARNPGL